MAMPFLMCGFMVISQGFWIWMIVDCATNAKLLGNDKLIWILIVIFTNWIGALIYCIVQRPKKWATIPPPRMPPPKPPPIPPPLQNQPAAPIVDPDKKYYENYER